jgi:hypothetical protein
MYLAHAGESAADVGNRDGAAHDESDVEGVNDFFAIPAFFAAANEVIGDAIVTAEDGGGNQTEQFFCFRAESAGLIGLMIESEETLDAEVAAAEDFLVQISASLLKMFKAVRHESSESGANIMD